MKKVTPYIIAIVVFIIASVIYFNPVLSGKHIKQGDITQFSGMAKETVEYRKAHNDEEPYWLGNAFSGMPAYQVSAYFPNDFMRYIDKALRFLPRPADYLFLYFMGFFFLLTSLKVDWKLAILGALSFGFSTYLIIIFGAGHNAKAHAIAYMPLVIAGFLYVFRKKYFLGFIITAFGMALEIYANHPQMTYYLGFCLLILGVVETIEAVKKKEIPALAKQVGVLLLAVFLGVGVNATRLLSMKEYADHSTRGKSELTFNPDGSPKTTSGLDKSYITEYSYGKLETFNLFIPRFMGGGTIEELGENSEFYKVLAANASPQEAKEYSSQALTYWGDQPIVEAPAYIGAIIFFLFLLAVFLFEEKFKITGIFILSNVLAMFLPSPILGQIVLLLSTLLLLIYFKNKMVKWLFASVIFSILLSWGKNFNGLTNFFIDYVPLYDKFRAVSSIQVIAELCVPLLAFLGLRAFFSSEKTTEEKIKALMLGTLTFIGLAVFGVILAYATSDFIGIRDAQYESLPPLMEALISDRKSMLIFDSLRSVVLVVISGGVLYFFLKDKIKKVPVLLVLALLILGDLISVDMRYVNNDDFESARSVKVPFVANDSDKQIMEDTSHYRVANFTSNLMNEARTSYFHNSIGGYHAAKMKRYQELFDYQFNGRNQNPQVLNMLNAKYIIVGTGVQVNPDANGNAWFVEGINVVEDADNEIKLLRHTDTKKTAIVNNQKFGTYFKGGELSFPKDSTATIDLKNYKSNHLTYETNTKTNQFVVFSEIYYKEGWNAYVDDELVPHIQVDYVLRGMKIPAGKHTVDFKFEPQVIEKGSAISLVSYALLLLIPLSWFFYEKKRK